MKAWLRNNWVDLIFFAFVLTLGVGTVVATIHNDRVRQARVHQSDDDWLINPCNPMSPCCPLNPIWGGS